MTSTASQDQIVRDILDANLSMVLATADQSGRPWATPVYFADQAGHEFYWVSSPHSAHSRNIAVRPQVAIVVFDSSVPIGTGQGVYMSAVAEPTPSTRSNAGSTSSPAARADTAAGRGRLRTCKTPPASGCTAPRPKHIGSSPTTNSPTTESQPTPDRPPD